jgi:MYXO-CTERM domain-containing protein
MCPDAGIDAGPDVATTDAFVAETGNARDVAAPIDAIVAPDVASPIDAGSRADAGADASSIDAIAPPAPDAPNESSTPPDLPPPVDAGGSRDARNDAARAPGANEDSGPTGDSGCSCRAVSSTSGRTSAAMWVAMLLLVFARRRASRRNA